MKKHNILSKLKRISRKIACIIATAVMCLNNIGLNQIKQVSAQTSMGMLIRSQRMIVQKINGKIPIKMEIR